VHLMAYVGCFYSSLEGIRPAVPVDTLWPSDRDTLIRFSRSPAWPSQAST
jgi:hypothetical protein